MLNAFTYEFGDYPFFQGWLPAVEALYSASKSKPRLNLRNHFEMAIWAIARRGIATRFDFIIVHESAHSGFGNASTAKDRSACEPRGGRITASECSFELHVGQAGRAHLMKYRQGEVNKTKCGPLSERA